MKPHVTAGIAFGVAMTIALVAGYFFKVWTRGITPTQSDIILLLQAALVTGVIVGGIVAVAVWWARR